jgi:hypothetical protein
MTFRWSTIVTLLAAAVLLPAEASNPLPYTGVLLDPAGRPLLAPVSLQFRIFRGGDDSTLPSTGTLVYHESLTVVPVEGTFTHLIGTGVPAADCSPGNCVLDASTFANDAPMWIELTVGVDVLLPRVRVGTVAYAYRVVTLEAASGGTVTGTLRADVLTARTGTVGDGLACSVELRFDSSNGSTQVTWDAARSELACGARTRHAAGLSIDPDQPLQFGAAEVRTSDEASSSLLLGADAVSTTLRARARFASAAELNSLATFRADVGFEREKGFVLRAAGTFPGGQSNGSPGAGVQFRSFLHEPFDQTCDAPGSVAGSDTEFIWATYYNARPDNLLNRENHDDYSLGFQFTAGWTHLSGDRRAEYIFRHITKDGSKTWAPFYWNIVGLDTNRPLVDYTIRTSPDRIGMRVNPTSVSFGGAPTGNGDLEVPAGTGTLYLAGSTGGRIKLEGSGNDEIQTEVTARDPTVDRAIELPNGSGRVQLNPHNPHIGTVMFGDSDDTGDTGNEVCRSVNLTCLDVRSMNGQDSDCVTDQGALSVLYFVFCRQ